MAESTSLIYDNNAGILTVNEVENQVNMIQHLMRKVMKEDVHYGKIPGCGDKPVLLKAGAEKLCFTFRMNPEMKTDIKDFPGGHREYITTCSLTHIPTGNVLATAQGSCSTMEKKYRYNWENTEKLVPASYWDTRDNGVLGGNRFQARKSKVWDKEKREYGPLQWYIFESVERDDISDQFNTCLKMSNKRALTAATLLATAASDIFSQDLEEELEGVGEQKNRNSRAAGSKGTSQAPPQEPPKDNGEWPDEKKIAELEFKGEARCGSKNDFIEWMKGKNRYLTDTSRIKSLAQCNWLIVQLDNDFPVEG